MGTPVVKVRSLDLQAFQVGAIKALAKASMSSLWGTGGQSSRCPCFFSPWNSQCQVLGAEPKEQGCRDQPLGF